MPSAQYRIRGQGTHCTGSSPRVPPALTSLPLVAGERAANLRGIEPRRPGLEASLSSKSETQKEEGEGFEPPFAGSEPTVLPLDEPSGNPD